MIGETPQEYLRKNLGNGGLVWITHCAVFDAFNGQPVEEWGIWDKWRKEYEKVYWL